MTSPSLAREALAIYGIEPRRENEYPVSYRVGDKYQMGVEREVTRITIVCDLPGLHGFMERARVYDGATVIFEAPVHNLEGIEYTAPHEGES